MPSVGITAGAGAVPEPRAETGIETQAALQAIKEGTPDEVAEAFAMLEAFGDVEPDIDWEESAPEDLDDYADALDAEIDSSDDDDPFLEGADDDPLEVTDVPLVSDDSAEWDLEMTTGWRMTVDEDGVCKFARPHAPRWVRMRAKSKGGKDAIETAERRMRMMERIAEWMTENRSEFLLEPEPWNLGLNAWTELKEGRSPVVPGHFQAIAQIDGLCGDASTFSRYRRAMVLVWSDAIMPFDFLFDQPAQTAWVAQAIRKAALEAGAPVLDVLDQCRKARKPRLRAKKRELTEAKIEHLEWPEIAARASDLAGVKWDDVLKLWEKRMLEASK